MTDTPELDNDVMLPEELMVILPWPIEAVIQLCEEIQDDQKQGFY